MSSTNLRYRLSLALDVEDLLYYHQQAPIPDTDLIICAGEARLRILFVVSLGSDTNAIVITGNFSGSRSDVIGQIASCTNAMR